MIPKEYKGEWLIGETCRPIRPISNGYGVAVTPDTACVIDDVRPGKGITIRTEICPQCGQYSYITRVGREHLELVPESAQRVAQKHKEFKRQQREAERAKRKNR